MKLVSWNVNGIRSIAKKGLVDFLDQQRPDVLCIQETKIQDDQLKKLNLFPENYSYYVSSAEKKGYSGVLTLLNDKHPGPKKNHLKFGIGNDKFDNEGRFVISDHGKFLLYNVYIPSGTSGEVRQDFKYEFLDAFLEHLSKLSKKDRERLIICGDFNICHREIDIHHPKVARQRQLSGFLDPEREWIDSFLSLGLKDAFRETNGEVSDVYTWWSYRAGSRGKNLGWRIDYFFVSEALRELISQADIYTNIPGSDHCPISLELK